MSDTSEHLFNFVPLASSQTQSQSERESGVRRLSLGVKRKATPVYSFIKKPHRNGGTKVIKIEIYDSNKLNENFEHICKCNAELCAQYVVKNTLLDQVYELTRRVIDKIDEGLSSDTPHGYTIE
ncbi:uncharacterized protein LOC125242407 [Leguminivora glycinivorella]|uniref:uncharacterized protein LOC125226821 n=1 Tax=Leguminivora glycinivorella TaxID=1035111 RepID=UPI0020107BF3|nr:uncharacterized protein LOC125225821 isoform X1 [Leguminivora glycinivorella]XP_047986396.1 uncharacterized protein LOC125226455 isoform X1 [Leguminivora glycinivorella]XP_047986894.1 uncharacterized protein LOC125226821 [Leguminivora glycinivorella]XP_047990202.1 uncharacterized protein LOC125229417 [Leguminivora glycinivorella]XP_047991125.1 uncharacterized protein LOC125230133 [Leguminivora glycinivorella]XP_047991163.1 uncharacterized protein LOC125230158 [Leguminivora glycinivorella]X